MGYKFSPSAGSIAIIGRCKNGPPLLLFLHIQSGGGEQKIMPVRWRAAVGGVGWGKG